MRKLLDMIYKILNLLYDLITIQLVFKIYIGIISKLNGKISKIDKRLKYIWNSLSLVFEQGKKFLKIVNKGKANTDQRQPCFK